VDKGHHEEIIVILHQQKLHHQRIQRDLPLCGIKDDYQYHPQSWSNTCARVSEIETRSAMLNQGLKI